MDENVCVEWVYQKINKEDNRISRSFSHKATKTKNRPCLMDSEMQNSASLYWNAYKGYPALRKEQQEKIISKMCDDQATKTQSECNVYLIVN